MDHPLYAGGVGPRGNPVASRLTREADCILALGTRLGFNTIFYRYTDIALTAQIIHVDIDPLAIGRYFPVALGVVADAGTGGVPNALISDSDSSPICQTINEYTNHKIVHLMDWEKQMVFRTKRLSRARNVVCLHSIFCGCRFPAGASGSPRARSG